jgi:hypothetical protein
MTPMRMGHLAVASVGLSSIWFGGCLGNGSGSLPCSMTASGGSNGIAGMQITLDTPSCAMQSGTGATFNYVITVGSALSFAEGPHGACTPTSTTDPSSFVEVFVTGSGGQYCPACDVGTCSADPGEQISIPSGNYMGSFEFPGRSWNGPAGINAPLGGPLPAGYYVAEVNVMMPIGMVSAELSITLQ